MKKPRARDLKYQARILMAGKYGTLAGITFIMMLLTMGLDGLPAYAFPGTDGFGSVLYLVSSILINMIYYILLAGLMQIYLHLCRGELFRYGDLFSAFRGHPEQIAIYSVLQFAIQTGAEYLFGYAFSQIRTAPRIVQMLPYLLILLALAAVLLWIHLCLALVLFLYCDAPWKSAPELIRDSYQMMRSNRKRMLCLYVSFLGVAVLVLLSFGIGALFVEPYLYVSLALFYLNLLEQQPQENENDGE